MGSLIPATCDTPPQIGDAPEWVHLMPGGRIVARDGRAWTLDNPDAVIAAFERGGIDLPVDYEHQNDRPVARLSGPVPAAGWIKALANRGGELWGRVEWTARARQLIADREYRYLSPTFLFDKTTRQVARLKGAGLVHNPALHLTALAAEEDTMNEDTPLIARMSKMLGLPEDAGEDDILAELEARLAEGARPDPRKYAPVEALQEAMRNRVKDSAALNEERARQKVEKAFDQGYLTPAMKTWALDLCQSDEEAFDTFLNMSVPSYAHMTRILLPDSPPQDRSAQLHDDNALAVCAQLGLTPDRMT